MKKRWLLVLFLFTVAACAPQDQVPQQEVIEAPDNIDLLTTQKCIPFNNPPTAISPIGGILDPSPPHVFTWDMDCIPHEYKIRLFKNGDWPAVEQFDDIDPTDKNIPARFNWSHSLTILGNYKRML